MYYNATEQKNLDKTLSLIWYNKDSNNNYIGFVDGFFSNSIPNEDDIENNKYFI
jgi:adenosine/AMP kinase